MGEATRFLKDEASTEIFKRATGHSLKSSTMRDREFINRFCAFSLLSLDDYRGDMDEFLAQALRQMNEIGIEALAKLSSAFRTSLANNLHVFDKHAFRKHHMGQDSRNVINASLWDVMSTGLAHYSEQTVEEHAVALKNAFYSLMDDNDFINAITYGTNDARQVRHRFGVIEAMLREVFGDYPA